MPDPDLPVLPAYGGGCVADVVPAVLEPGPILPACLPAAVVGARAVVMMVIDGLGWEQLRARPEAAPTLAGMNGGAITTVAPSTTSTALTSIVTGAGPGEHGIVGYRIAFAEGNLNVLRWTTPRGDARNRLVPEELQTIPAFMGHRSPVVTRTEFAGSGFTRAHLDGVRLTGYRLISSLVVEVRRLLAGGEPFVYAYYDGLDRIAHEYGLGEHYDTELRSCDRLVADLSAELPSGAALLVTADHGLVDCSDGAVDIDGEVAALVDSESGEARFRWLHARPGRAGDLAEAARSAHEHQAWVLTADRIVDEGWLGPIVTGPARSRLGDVALVARRHYAFMHPHDSTPRTLKGRHGSVTSAEMLVPALSYIAT